MLRIHKVLSAACHVLIISLVILPQAVISQYLPHIACPRYFQYLRSDGEYVGTLMIPNVSWGKTIVEVEFSQSGSLGPYSGTISVDESNYSAQYKINNKLPINFRIHFPIPSVLPKLTEIKVNGILICSEPRLFSENPGEVITTIRMKNTFRSFMSIYASTESPRTHTSNINPRMSNEQPEPPPPLVPPTATSNCGQEGSESLSPYIAGGTQLNIGQYPWMAAIFQKMCVKLKFICSGSLISSRTVLTAAHCIRMGSLTPTNMAVHFGRYNLSDLNEKFVEINLETVLIHPSYDRLRIPDADVALLFLATPVAFTDFIRPICLWAESDDVNLIVNATGTVAGWGDDGMGNDIFNTALPKKVEVRIASELQCLRSSYLFKPITSSRTLCAGLQNNAGPCMGDSGGGLMLKRAAGWTLRGVVSVGVTREVENITRCDFTKYVVYCDLAKHRSWIYDKML